MFGYEIIRPILPCWLHDAPHLLPLSCLLVYDQNMRVHRHLKCARMRCRVCVCFIALLLYLYLCWPNIRCGRRPVLGPANPPHLMGGKNQHHPQGKLWIMKGLSRHATSLGNKCFVRIKCASRKTRCRAVWVDSLTNSNQTRKIKIQ